MNLAGCATVTPVSRTGIEGISGIYHRVEKGQTLWSISKIYNVSLDELAKINRLLDTGQLEAGQLIFIPHRQKPHFLPDNAYAEDFNWPLKGKVIAGFGRTLHNMVNKGIDIKAERGSGVVAARSGRVIFYSPDFKGFGKTIIIDHNDGFSTIYARNSEVFVKIGDEVKKGSLISKAGAAGRNKSIYLHFEIRKSHIPQNPLFYLP